MLRCHKLGEADRIVTVLTRDRDRVRAVAKGVRRTASGFGARLEPLGHIDVQFHTGRSLEIVTQVESLHSYGSALTADYGRWTAAQAMVEASESSRRRRATPRCSSSCCWWAACGRWWPTSTTTAWCWTPSSCARWPSGMGAVVRGLRPLRRARPAPGVPPGRRRRALRGLPPARLRCAVVCRAWAHGGAAHRRLGAADASEPRTRREASGLTAAYTQWHLEHRLRALPWSSAPTLGWGRRGPGSVIHSGCVPERLASGPLAQSRSWPRPPTPHAGGAPPDFAPGEVRDTCHRDGRQRPLGPSAWPASHGRPRDGEFALLDVVHGAIEVGVEWLSVYAFSTENWKRSPDEVRFLMGFNRDVVRRRRDEMHELGIRVRWAGRQGRLWRSVLSELDEAERLTRNNSTLNLVMCINYGGRAELADAAARIAADVKAGTLSPARSTSDSSSAICTSPTCPTGPLRPLERRAAHQQLPPVGVRICRDGVPRRLWPDFDRTHLWHAIELYASRDRRYGGAPPVEPPRRRGDRGAARRRPDPRRPAPWLASDVDRGAGRRHGARARRAALDRGLVRLPQPSRPAPPSSFRSSSRRCPSWCWAWCSPVPSRHSCR